jgi:hypothetical protein
MRILIFYAFISLSLWAQTPELILKSALSPEDETCLEKIETTDHCQDFHRAGCEEEKFQFDGTNEVRTEKSWEMRVKEGTRLTEKELQDELKIGLKNLSESEWSSYLSLKKRDSKCVKYPASVECLNELSLREASEILDRLTSPKKAPAHGFLDPVEEEKEEPQILQKLKISQLEKKYNLKLLDRIRYKDDEEKMKKMAIELKDQLTQKIFTYITDESQRKIILSRLEKTEFTGFECGGNDHLKSYFVKGAFNTKELDKSQKIGYCAGNFSANNSAFNMAYLLVHEFAHSIDPCNLRPTDKSKFDRVFLESQHPFSNVISCLRSPDSIGAEFSDAMFSPEYPNSVFCRQDQITESFSDWLAAEVVPGYIQKVYPNLKESDYKQGYLNISRTLSCKKQPRMNGHSEIQAVSEHPKPESRINRLMMANPEIRKSVGCKESDQKITYCNGANDSSKLRPPGKRAYSKPTFPTLNTIPSSTYDSCFKK